jgi:hypothetical protein
MLDVEDTRFEIRECRPYGHKSLFARSSFEPGEALVPLGSSASYSWPDRYTVQVDRDRHIIMEPEFLLYLNHHCSPNTFLDVGQMVLRALAPISEGEELTFFYPSTEWSMSDGFDCHCGAAKCLGRIQGAAYIEDLTLRSYELSDHVKMLLRERAYASEQVR